MTSIIPPFSFYSVFRVGVDKVLLRVLLCLCVISAVGCSKKPEYQRAAASGTVTLDGKPLEEGTITIFPDVKVKGILVHTKIVGGKFSFKKEEGPSVGKQRVSITATKKTGQKVSNDGVESEETVQYIPWQFNEGTILTADIKAEPNKNEMTFELTGQAAARNNDGSANIP